MQFVKRQCTVHQAKINVLDTQCWQFNMYKSTMNVNCWSWSSQWSVLLLEMIYILLAVLYSLLWYQLHKCSLSQAPKLRNFQPAHCCIACNSIMSSSLQLSGAWIARSLIQPGITTFHNFYLFNNWECTHKSSSVLDLELFRSLLEQLDPQSCWGGLSYWNGSFHKVTKMISRSAVYPSSHSLTLSNLV